MSLSLSRPMESRNENPIDKKRKSKVKGRVNKLVQYTNSGKKERGGRGKVSYYVVGNLEADEEVGFRFRFRFSGERYRKGMTMGNTSDERDDTF